MPNIKITKGTVDKLPHPTKGQMLYMDQVLKGFGVLVGMKSKTYVAQRDISGRTVRHTIGRHGVISTHNARTEAQNAINLMRQGINPNKQKRAAAVKGMTLQDAMELYLASSKPRSTLTIQGFKDSFRLHLADWRDKPLAEITRKMVYDRHQRIGERIGHYAANSAMRTFRAAYNRAMRQQEDLPANPIINVEWFPEFRRDAAIPADRLGDWHLGIMSLSNPIRNDYYFFVLFSGLRRRSAAEIRWEHVDLDKGTLLIPNPKGGKERAFILPLSDKLVEILARRKDENEPFFPDSPWAFPANRSKSGHISEPKLKPSQKVAVGVDFSIHGLRHTWMTAANAAGLSPYDIKMLANHSLPKGDVTAGYIGAHVEALRASQQRVADYLCSLLALSD